MIKAHPWFGVGPEQVKPQFDRYVPPDIPRPLPLGWYGHLHNIYVHYAAERGVPTMLMLVWLLVKVLFDFLSAIRKLPPGPGEAKALLHGCVAVVVAVMVEGVFELNLGDSEVLMMFLTVVACGYAARDRALEASLPAA
jgi:O-antigen ligase